MVVFDTASSMQRVRFSMVFAAILAVSTSCKGPCRAASGVAGDGKSITCENNDGWRWEPV